MDSHKSDSSMNLFGVKARSSPNSTLFHHWLWLEVNPDASLFVFDARVRDNDVDGPHECSDPFDFSGNVFPPLVRSHDGPHGHRWDRNSAAHDHSGYRPGREFGSAGNFVGEEWGVPSFTGVRGWGL